MVPHMLRPVLTKPWFLLLLAVGIAACTSTNPYVAPRYSDWPATEPPAASLLDYRVFLIGDVGDINGSSDVLRTLKNQLDLAGEDAAVVFLGDNIYCCGLPDSASAKRAGAENNIRVQMDAAADFQGRIVFLPGNHDWNHSRPGGLEAVMRQEAFVEDYLDRGNTFRPDQGFPGPDVIKLTDRVRLVVIDTQWWLSREARALGEYQDRFDIEEEGDFLLALNEVITDHDDEDLLVVAHHPLFSNSKHGGRYPLKAHLFPLTELFDKAYIPFPVVGSLLPLYVRYIGGRQDIAHPRYRAMKAGLLRAFSDHESIIYASGHDHSLQYFEGEHTFIVSGAGSRPHHVAPGGKASFAYGKAGFSTLQYYKNGEIWIEMWAPDASAPEGRMLFRNQIKGPARDAVDPEVPEIAASAYPDYSDSTFVMAANKNYQRGPAYEFFLGKHNRDIWATEVEVPYLDMGRAAGGLVPVKRGGGMQTFSLRLEGADGHEYVLRSIDKDPSVSIPEAFRETVAREIVQDQIASINPYGAFIIPKLAAAAGVFHTRPQLVYVPDDPRLGVYREQFGRQLMMFEIRPNNDMSDKPEFGNTEDIVSAAKFYEEITSDNDHRVDEAAFVRARLFDMLLSDWDRHRLQWRWATFEPDDKKGKIYRPIPRDRDWAFNRFDGVMPKLTRLGFDPKFQDFTADYGNIRGLTKNGNSQDRRLTAWSSLETWIEIAQDLQHRLTDDIIQEAVKDWPESVHLAKGDETVSTLKIRRDRLIDAAEAYYRILAKDVDLVGSNKHERFEVHRLNDQETEVVLFKTNKKGEITKELARRTFFRDETREIRLYGLHGNDQFEISGRVNSGIRIRAIGGTGDDTFVDASEVVQSGRKAYFYDTYDGTTHETGPNSVVRQSTDPAINTYNQVGYLHDVVLPQVFFGRNQDDGLFIGGGLKFVKHGFRARPYASQQRILGNVSALTRAVNLVYDGVFTDAIGTLDVLIEADYRTPNTIRNYFGLGNETENTVEDAEFYRARISTGTFAPAILFQYEEALALSVGAKARYIDIRTNTDSFLGQEGISNRSFRDQVLLGFTGKFVLNATDHPANPRQGVLWENDAEVNIGVTNAEDLYTKLSSSISFYASPSVHPQVTFATRVGVAHNIGDFPFYGANTLGGQRTLRGWRSNRFAGRTSFYTNAELRAKLLNFNSYLAIGDFGMLAFFDNGRVWTEADATPGRVWHQGYGGGLWVSLFDAFVINGTYGISEEDGVFTLDLGFLF